MPDQTMEGMDSKDIKILLRVDRQETLRRFLGNLFIPLLDERGYSTEDLFGALAGWAFDSCEKAIAHHLWDAADKFYVN